MKRYILVYLATCLVLTSCFKENLGINEKSTNLNLSNYPVGSGDVVLRFSTSKAVMGFKSDPIINFYPMEGTVDPAKVEKVYVFGAVNQSPNITMGSGNATPGAYTFLFYESNSLNGLHNVNFNVPGWWKLKAAILYDGQVYYSNEYELEIWFPSVYEMQNNSELTSKMESLWQETLNFASSSSRKEFGFWICAYVDSNGKLHLEEGEHEKGKPVDCDETNAAILPSIPKTNSPNKPDDINVKFYIGYFHTHTPLTYCTSGSRKTGISDGDITYAEYDHIPVLLYDYTDPRIYAGHSLNGPYGLSYVTTVNNRETPTFWIGN